MATPYITRPIFALPVDWRSSVAKRVSFDDGEQMLGFGAEFFTALQAHVVQGFQLHLTLRNSDELTECDEFFAALTGRLRGFWLPAPFQAMEIREAISGTQFKIRDQGLRDTFGDHPDVHLLFRSAGIADRIGKITNVAATGDGIHETVTLQAAVDPSPAVGDAIYRMHYVRLADDIERGQFMGEGVMERDFNVVELPHEYAAVETGEQPIYLYHFWCAAPVDTHWRYTSFAASVVSGNQLFTKFEMTHGAIKDSTRLDSGVNLEAKYDANHPLALFLPRPFPRRMNVEVLKVSYADPDTQTKLFVGQVRVVDDRGQSLTARCDSWPAILARKVPGMMITPGCNYDVFNPRTCKAVRAMFETSGVIIAKDNAALPPTVTIEFDHATAPQLADWMSADWWAFGGFIETGFALNYELRSVLTSAATGNPAEIELELNGPLNATVGARMQLVPGCSGEWDHCADKFSNADNFGGFRAVPNRNLSLKAVDAIVSQGDKK